MSGPVIVATHSVDGLVIRWRRHTASVPILSASRNNVTIHGDAYLDEDLDQWITDAKTAHQALKDGRAGEARALATHRQKGLFGDELVPIKAPDTEISEADQP